MLTLIAEPSACELVWGCIAILGRSPGRSPFAPLTPTIAAALPKFAAERLPTVVAASPGFGRGLRLTTGVLTASDESGQIFRRGT